jgi:hypothetical protein
MPAWLHARAKHILAKNPAMDKQQAFAIATQQGHRLGKNPKGWGTPEGRANAREKYMHPKKMYVKTPNPGNLESSKLAGPVEARHPPRWARGAVKPPAGGNSEGTSWDPDKEIYAYSFPQQGLAKESGLLAKIPGAPVFKSLGSPKVPTPKVPSGMSPAKKLRQSQDMGSVGAFNQKTQGLQLRKFQPLGMPKVGFQASQYSGPLELGLGPMQYRNPMGMPGPSSFPQHEFTTRKDKLAGPPPEEEVSKPAEKKASIARAALFAIGALGSWQAKYAAPMTPTGKLNASQQVGAPKVTAPPGPSIAQIAKPVGFGRALSGTTKTTG